MAKRNREENKRFVAELAKAGASDWDITKKLDLSTRYVRELRLEIGIRKPTKSPFLAMKGLRTSNLSDREIARLYNGARYSANGQ